MSRSNLIANIIICLLLLIACTGLAFWSRTTYKTEKLKAKQLKEGFQETTLILKETNAQLQKQTQQNSSLTEKNKGLNKEIVSLKENIADIQETKDGLDKQSKGLSKELERLEARLAEVMLSAQEQISLKEKDFKEKLDAEEEKFQLQKKVLSKQIESQEVMFKKLGEKNEEVLARLKKNEEVVAELQKDKLSINLQQTQLELEEKQVNLNEMIKQSEMLVEEFNRNKTEKGQIANQLKQAQEELRRQTAKFHYNLGLVYDQGRRYKEALAEYKKALEIAWDDPDIHYNLAILYDEHIIDKRKALKHYQAYLELCPGALDADKVAFWIENVKRELKFQ